MANDESHDRLVQRLTSIGELNETEQAALRTLPMRVRDHEKGADIVRQGDRPTECCLVISGLACRYKLVAGGKRQILSLHFAGDMPDLQGLQLEVMDHGIGCITGVRAAFVAHQAVIALWRQHPHIGDLLFKHTLMDGAIFRDWIANLGRRSAYERIAHLFCEVFVRMRQLGLVERESFRLPMTQSELADACGISPVHVNRVLQQLRRDGLIVSTGDVHAIANWEALREAGDFDDMYLHQG
jgi:CRP-like cAMP-binding protein